MFAGELPRSQKRQRATMMSVDRNRGIDRNRGQRVVSGQRGASAAERGNGSDHDDCCRQTKKIHPESYVAVARNMQARSWEEDDKHNRKPIGYEGRSTCKVHKAWETSAWLEKPALSERSGQAHL